MLQAETCMPSGVIWCVFSDIIIRLYVNKQKMP